MSTEPLVMTAQCYSGRRSNRNGAISGAQVVTVGVTLLLAYRLALMEVSRDEFGLYATMFGCGTPDPARRVATARASVAMVDVEPSG